MKKLAIILLSAFTFSASADTLSADDVKTCAKVTEELTLDLIYQYEQTRNQASYALIPKVRRISFAYTRYAQHMNFPLHSMPERYPYEQRPKVIAAKLDVASTCEQLAQTSGGVLKTIWLHTKG